MYKILLIVCLVILFSIPYTLHTEADFHVEPVKSIDQLVTEYSTKYGVSATTINRVMKCENNLLDPTLQSRLKYKSGNRWGFPAGTYEKSYGLAQIHLPDHPSVSYEQATNAEYSIEFMAKNISQGRGKMWTCYRTIFG